MYRLGLVGAAVVQDLCYRHAEWVFIDAGTLAVAADGVQFGAAAVRGANGGPPGAAVQRNLRRRAEGFHVVDDGRLAQVALLDREGRADARRAALAFERLDQRAFFAADISARAHMNGDVKVKPLHAQNAVAQQALRAPTGERGLQCVEQVAVFAAQVQQPGARVQQPRCHGHALEHRVGLAVEQHTVLEGAGFAFVGIAHHHAGAAFGHGGRMAQRPLACGGKPCAAPAAQPGRGQFGHGGLCAPCLGGLQGLTLQGGGVEQNVAAPHLVVHLHPVRGPVGQGHLAEHPISQFAHTLAVHPRDYMLLVDQQRGALIAQAGARGKAHAGQAVGTNSPRGHFQQAA